MSDWHYERMGLMPQHRFRISTFTLSVRLMWIQPKLGEDHNKVSPFHSYHSRFKAQSSHNSLSWDSSALSLSSVRKTKTRERRENAEVSSPGTNLFVWFGVSDRKENLQAPPDQGPPGRPGTLGFPLCSCTVRLSFCFLATESTQTSTGVKWFSTCGGLFMPNLPNDDSYSREQTEAAAAEVAFF